MNNEQLERLTAEAAMLRGCIAREIGRAQTKLTAMHAKLMAGEFPTRDDGLNLQIDVFRTLDGFAHLYDVEHSLKRMKGEA